MRAYDLTGRLLKFEHKITEPTTDKGSTSPRTYISPVLVSSAAKESVPDGTKDVRVENNSYYFFEYLRSAVGPYQPTGRFGGYGQAA